MLRIETHLSRPRKLCALHMYVPLSCSWTFWITSVPFGKTSKRWALEWIDITAPGCGNNRQQSEKQRRIVKVRKWINGSEEMRNRDTPNGTAWSKTSDAVHRMFYYFLKIYFSPHGELKRSLLCACQCIMMGVNGVPAVKSVFTALNSTYYLLW